MVSSPKPTPTSHNYKYKHQLLDYRQNFLPVLIHWGVE